MRENENQANYRLNLGYTQPATPILDEIKKPDPLNTSHKRLFSSSHRLHIHYLVQLQHYRTTYTGNS